MRQVLLIGALATICAGLSGNPYCESGWTFFSKTSQCYKRYFNSTFDEAEITCQNSGSHLASIHSEEENAFARDLGKAGITFNDQKWNQLIWIGMYNTGGKWTNKDGTVTDFFKWVQGRPDRTVANQSCVAMFTDANLNCPACEVGEYVDASCTDVMRGFVCKKDAQYYPKECNNDDPSINSSTIAPTQSTIPPNGSPGPSSTTVTLLPGSISSVQPITTTTPRLPTTTRPTPVCTPTSCGANATCSVSNNQLNCVCNMGYSGDPVKGCGVRVRKSCAWGDPHYSTFDGFGLDYMTTCPVVYSKPCTKLAGGYDNFEVVHKNELPYPFARASYVTEVDITMFGQKIHFDRIKPAAYFNKVKISGFPYYWPTAAKPSITINFVGGKFSAESIQLVAVTLSINAEICVIVPDIPEFQGNQTLCGIAGNIDNNKMNDVVMSNGTVFQIPANYTRLPTGSTAVSFYKAADTWIVKDFFYTSGSPINCSAGENFTTTPPCNPGPALTVCKPILDAKTGNGLFSMCSAMDKDLIQQLYDGCIYDVCQQPTFKCDALSGFISACQLNLPNTDVGLWRSNVSCPMTCGSNAMYSGCMSSCPATCSDADPAICKKGCVEGCQCLPGFVVDTTKTSQVTCVKIEECGCTDPNGNYHTANEEFLDKNCTVTAKCSNGVYTSQPTSCSANGECTTDDNFNMACKCKEQYTGDGFTCLPGTPPTGSTNKPNVTPTIGTTPSESSGPSSTPGPSGSSITPGPSGSSSTPGPSGSPITPGPSGSSITPGPSGSSSTPEPSGSSSTPGPSGSSSTPGPSGSSITPGPSGSSSTPGPSGSSSTPGPSGSSSTPGPSGSSITPGPSGSSSTPGPSGSPITPGPSGSSITPGPSGSSSTPGPSGSSSTPGPSGSSITPGPSGSSSTPGPSGSPITPGPSGSSITPGPSGSSSTSRNNEPPIQLTTTPNEITPSTPVPIIPECSPTSCGANATCSTNNNQIVCVCNMGYSGDPYKGCGVRVRRSCAWGDPHYTTFDGFNIDYQTTCPVVYSKPCTKLAGGYDNFEVVHKNELPYPGSSVSYVTEVDITMFGQKIHFDRIKPAAYFNKVKISGFPYYWPTAAKPSITINFIEGKFSAESIQLVAVTLSINAEICVIVPDIPEFQGNQTLCGIAGNIDNNKMNDVVMSNGTVFQIPANYTRLPTGDTAVSFYQAADTWIVKDFFYTSGSPICTKNLTSTPQCDRIQAIVTCQPILDAKNGVGLLSMCSGMSKDTIQQLYDGCVFDVCQDKSLKCDALTAFVSSCQTLLPNTDVGSWRNNVSCPKTCGANAKYSGCTSSCAATCNLPNSGICNKGCVEGCQCQPGFVIDTTNIKQTTCVKIEECGCTDPNGNYHTANEEFLDKNCTVTAKCSNGVYTSQPTSCSANGECTTDDNFNMACKCKEQYTGDGFTCLPGTPPTGSTNKPNVTPTIGTTPSESSGPSGSPITPGPSGSSSTPGPSGSPITPGPSGSSSTPGPSGSPITPGPSGSSSTPGPSGSSITPGPSGPSSTPGLNQPESTPAVTGNPSTKRPPTECELRAKCDLDWKYFELTNSCYKTFPNGSFDRAEDVCKIVGGHLASIHSPEENSFVYSLANTGKSGNYENNIWIGMTRINGTLVYVDGSQVDYTNWAPGEPNNVADNENCVQIFTDTVDGCPLACPETKWNDRPCGNVQRAFVCKKVAHDSQKDTPASTNAAQTTQKLTTDSLLTTKEPTTVSLLTTKIMAPMTTQLSDMLTTMTPDSPCASGWSYFDKTKSCYKTFLNGSFTDGENNCQAQGAHLTSIHSKEENTFVYNLAHSGATGGWLSQTWIGISRVNGTFVNNDGTPFDYFTWQPREPDNAQGIENCIVMVTDKDALNCPDCIDGGWNDILCTNNMRAYVCKKSTSLRK